MAQQRDEILLKNNGSARCRMPKSVRTKFERPSAGRIFAIVLLAMFWTAGTLLAQIDTGSIVGTVRDASGALINNAAITLTDKATGQTLKTTSNSAGEYQFNALRPGHYSVKAASAGFAAQQYADVQVDVQSRPSV